MNKYFASAINIFPQAVLIFLLISTPLAFGAVEPWSLCVFQCSAGALCLVWFYIAARDKYIVFMGPEKNSSGVRKYILNPYIPVIMFIMFSVFQIMPLPSALLELLSPKAKEIYSSAAHFINSSVSYFPVSLNVEATKQELLKYFCYAALFAAVVNYIKTQKLINISLGVIVTLGFLISVFAILQKFTWSGKIYWIRQMPETYGVYGPFVNYDHYGGYMNMAIMAGFGFIFSGIKNTKKLLIGFMSAIMASSLFLSHSRGALLSFSGALVYIIFILFIQRVKRNARKSLKAVYSLAALICVIFIFVYWIDWGAFSNRFKTLLVPEINFINPRIDIWKDALPLAKNYLTSGSGAGTFSQIFPVYQQSYTNMFWRHVHNDYFELLIESGLVSLVLGFWFVASLFTIYIKKIIKSTNVDTKGLLIGVSAAVFTMLLHSFVDFNMRITSNVFLFIVCAGIGISLTNITRRGSNAEQLIRLKPAAAYTISIFGILFSLAFIIMPAIRIYAAHRYSTTPSAVNEMSMAIALRPSNASFYHKLGLLYENNAADNGILPGEKEKYLSLSDNNLQMAILLSPATADYWASYGWLLANRGYPVKGALSMQRALSLAPAKENIRSFNKLLNETFITK